MRPPVVARERTWLPHCVLQALGHWHRDRHIVKFVPYCAAENILAEARVAITAHGQKIGVMLVGLVQLLVANLDAVTLGRCAFAAHVAPE